jgi:anti-anti-sigma regulatory factor
VEAGIRVFEVAGRSLVITLSGVVDASCTGRLADEVGSSGNRHVVVDLRDATHVDGEVQSFLVSAAQRAPLTIVAEQWLLHVFELTRHTRSLRLATSLAAAL